MDSFFCIVVSHHFRSLIVTYTFLRFLKRKIRTYRILTVFIEQKGHAATGKPFTILDIIHPLIGCL